MRSNTIFSVALCWLLAACTHEDHRPHGGNLGPGDDGMDAMHDDRTGSRDRRGGAEAGSGRTMYFPTGEEEGSSLRLDKDAPKEIRVGQAYTETLTVMNTSSQTLHGVVVRESLSPNFEPGPGGDAQLSPGEARWMVGTLKPGESRTLRLSGKAKGEGDLVHCANASFESRLCSTSTAVVPRLELSLTGPKEALSCEPIVYEGVVRNTGSARLADVRLEDPLPEGLLAEAGQKDSFAHAVGNLEPGESKPFTMRLKAARPGTYSGKASAASGDVRVESPWSTVVREPVLELITSPQQDRYLGTTAQAEVTVKNTGDGHAPDTLVEWSMPAGASFTSASEGGKASGRTASWRLGTLAPGESRRIAASYTSDQVGSAPGRIKATARCAKPVSADVRTEFRGVPAVLLEVVDDNDPSHLGDRVTYTIKVTNQGTARLTNVRVVCDLEEGMDVEGTKGETEGRRSDRAVTFEPLGSLETGAQAVWRLAVRGNKLADARFKVKVTTEQTGRPVEETESTHFISR